MPAIQFAPPFRARRGVTLLELLVVLVLMGISAAVVIPALDPPVELRSDSASALVERARRAAISRGEPVRLRIEGDGAWALVSLRDGVPLAQGEARAEQQPTATSLAIDLRIDAMGSCTPASTLVGATGDAVRFDPLVCRFGNERAP